MYFTQNVEYNVPIMWKHFKNAIGWEGLSFVTLSSTGLGFLFADKFTAARVCFWLAAASLVVRLTVYSWANFDKRARWLVPVLCAVIVVMLQVGIVLPWVGTLEAKKEAAAHHVLPQLEMEKAFVR